MAQPAAGRGSMASAGTVAERIAAISRRTQAEDDSPTTRAADSHTTGANGGKAPSILQRRRSSRLGSAGPYAASDQTRRSSSNGIRCSTRNEGSASTGLTMLMTDATLGAQLCWDENADTEDVAAEGIEADAMPPPARKDGQTAAPSPEPLAEAGEDEPAAIAMDAAGTELIAPALGRRHSSRRAAVAVEATRETQPRSGPQLAPFPPPPADRRRAVNGLVGQFPNPPVNPAPGKPIAASFPLRGRKSLAPRRHGTKGSLRGKAHSS